VSLVALYETLAALPIEIDGYELEQRDRVFDSGFERPSTLITIGGGGERGVGEDVVYDMLDHVAMRDAGPVHDLTGAATLGELCELVGSLDLFPTPPVRDFSPLYRRWAFESAALDLALRQAGRPLHDVVGRELRPLNFVCSVRTLPVAEGGVEHALRPVTDRLAKHPTLRFKLDPQTDWSDELIERLVETGAVDSLDLKGCYKNTPVDVETDPALYARLVEAFPDAWLEDPDISDETRTILEPHLDRVTWDAPIHSIDDIRSLSHRPRIVNVKPSRIGSLEELFGAYEYCEAEGIGAYGGGQTELAVGRDHIQYLASMMHPDTPNDVAPGGYNESDIPDGLPDSPLELRAAPVGFGLARD
jgi:L-alanine-DL-glutamate epimerase-like enolase superfamily enzyme